MKQIACYPFSKKKKEKKNLPTMFPYYICTKGSGQKSKVELPTYVFTYNPFPIICKVIYIVLLVPSLAPN